MNYHYLNFSYGQLSSYKNCFKKTEIIKKDFKKVNFVFVPFELKINKTFHHKLERRKI